MGLCITSTVCLHADVNASDYIFQVQDEEKVLEMSLPWPKTMIILTILLTKWFNVTESTERIENYHPKYVRFEVTLTWMRDTVENDAKTVISQISTS